MNRDKNSGLMALLVTGGVLLTTLVFPAYGAELVPRGKWKVGDWWTVKLSREASQKKIDKPGWQAMGKWKFTVADKKGDVFTLNVKETDGQRVVGSTWDLKLKINASGKLLDAKYRIDDEIYNKDEALFLLPLKEFGLSAGKALKTMLSPQSLQQENTIMAYDIRIGANAAFVQLESANHQARQMWQQGDPWWRYYESEESTPVRAALVDASAWKK